MQVTPNSNAIQFVKSEEVFKSFYDVSIEDTFYLRYYQISMYPNSDNKFSIRSIMFKGIKNAGVSFFDFHILKEKMYLLEKNKLDQFMVELQKQQSQNNIKIMHKVYPVVDIRLQEYPTGDELYICSSSLCMS